MVNASVEALDEGWETLEALYNAGTITQAQAQQALETAFTTGEIPDTEFLPL
jgi:hypothetical protein